MTDDCSRLDRSVWVDDARLVPLGRYGLPDYEAAVAIDSDGEECLVLARVDGNGGIPWDWRKVAPHELVGRLPKDWAKARGLCMCGRKSGKGTPCRNFVALEGAACEFHRAM